MNFFIFLSLQFSNIKIFHYTFLRNCDTPGNVVMGNQTVMQRKSLRLEPVISYGLDSYVNNKVNDPVLILFDSVTARY